MLPLCYSIQLTVDIMFVNKLPFFITLTHMIKFGSVKALPNRKVPTVVAKLKSVLRMYAHCGFKVSVISLDSVFEPVQPSFPMLNTCSSEEYVPEIEQYIRTIKDNTQSTYRMLPFWYIACLILIHLVRNAVFWLKVFPSSDGVLSSNSSW